MKTSYLLALHGVFVLNTRMLTSLIYPALIVFQGYASHAAKLVCQRLQIFKKALPFL